MKGFYRDGPGNSMGLSSLLSSGAEEGGDDAKPMHAAPKGKVFNLVFKGDVQASQGKALRREITAVIANSSPGDQVAASVRARSKVSAVMLRPNTIPRGSAPSRSAVAAAAKFAKP